jgi:hypothetical protein
MKKITLSLFAIIGLSTSFFGQAVISVEAPQYSETEGSWAAFATPSGTASSAYHRACYFVTASELARLAQTNSVITSFGLDFIAGAGTAPTAGQFTLYLQNTSDALYSKSLTFTTALQGMTQTYTGNLSVPARGAAATPTVATVVNLSTPFTYTGGGLYVAWDWFGATANATSFSRAMCNVGLPAASAGANAVAPSAGPAPTALTPSQFRPCMRFGATNTATNEVSVVRINALGAVTKIGTTGEAITAQIRNNGINALSNVPVTLSITGANPFTNTQTLSTIAAGAIATVTFSNYNPTANGQSTMVVTVPNDQYAYGNSTWAWTQTVSCSDVGNSPSFLAPDFNDGPYGYGGPAALVTKLTPSNNATLTAIKFVIPTGAANVAIRGVFLDASGTLVAATKSVNVNGPAAASGQVYTTYKFDTILELTAGTLYYYGIEQLNSGFVFATTENYNFRQFSGQFFNAPAGGGSIGGVQNQMGYVAMQSVLNFSNTYITASATKTLVCNNRGVSIGDRDTTRLVASGVSGQTFAWTPGISTSSNGLSIVVSPSLNANQGLFNYSVTATHVASGCKSNVAVITLSIQNCFTSLVDNTGFGTSIVVYPNPVTNNKTTVKGLEGSNTITVFNVLGQSVLNFTTKEEDVEIDLSNQPTGNYMVKITNSSTQSKVVKVIKQN